MGDVKVCPVCQREYPASAVNCTEDGVPLVAMVTDVHGRSEDLVGQIVEGRYKIERIIGKGGMGTVYACRHVVVGKLAAMKVLRAGVERADGVLQRFVREAQTANLLKSRHIVEVSDFGQLPSGAFFVVMELLEGQDLARAMRNGLGRREMVNVFIQVAETLQLAHERGIVHRDLKPDNVFLVNEAGDPLFVKLLDFGIAKILHGDGNSGLTETGVILGTPYYMSPEQARAEAVDHRSDIYALGVMMYRAFTGRLPFMADSTMGVLTRHITEAPQPPSEIGQVDQATERMILRCLAKKPQYRFQSMREVADALRVVPLDPVPSHREQSTVYDGRVHTPRPTGQHTAASGQHAAALTGPSGAHQGMSFGPQQGTSGAFAAPPATSGAYNPPSISGGPSGAYTPAPTSGGQAAVGVGFPGFDPRVSSGPSPSGAHPGVSIANGVAAPGGATGSHAPVAEPTTSGVAANNYPVPQRNSNALLLVVGGLSTAALGAVAAFFLVGRPAPAPLPTPAAVTVIVTATAPPPVPPVPVATATATAATAAPTAPTASASAEPTVQPRPRGPAGPRSGPTSAPTATSKQVVRDIRSPFE